MFYRTIEICVFTSNSYCHVQMFGFIDVDQVLQEPPNPTQEGETQGWGGEGGIMSFKGGFILVHLLFMVFRAYLHERH